MDLPTPDRARPAVRPEPRASPWRRGRHAAAVLSCVLALSACGERSPLGPDVVAPPPEEPVLYFDSLAGPFHSHARIDCDVTVGTPSVSCGSVQAPAGVSPQIGGRGVHARLLTSGVSFDAGTRLLSMDVAVQNLLVNQIGTELGSVTGLSPFFTQSIGQGVTIANPDGTATFTGANQPYFHYPVKLGLLQSTDTKPWVFHVPQGVSSFQFRIYVSAHILPVIVFDRVSGDNRDIWRVAADGTDLVRLTSASTEELNPTAARNTVVFTRWIGDKASLWSVPLHGGPMEEFLSLPGNLGDPALDRTGSRVAFTRDAGGVSRIWIRTLTSTYLRPLTGIELPPEVIETSPVFDLSHGRLAFVSTIEGEPGIFRRRVGETPTVEALEVTADRNVDPAFSHDGSRVVFSSNRDGDPRVFMRPNTIDPGAPVTLLTTGVSAGHAEILPSFLSDGNVVYGRRSADGWRLRIYTFSPDAHTHLMGPTGEPRNPYGVPLWP